MLYVMRPIGLKSLVLISWTRLDAKLIIELNLELDEKLDELGWQTRHHLLSKAMKLISKTRRSNLQVSAWKFQVTDAANLISTKKRSVLGDWIDSQLLHNTEMRALKALE